MAGTIDLGDEVAALGRLIGLLKDTSEVEVDETWFEHAAARLESIDERLRFLADLVGGVLGPAVKNGPDVFKGACWYALPNPATGGKTALHLVMSPGTDKAGEVGVGVLHPLPIGDLTVQAYGYIPLFRYDGSGARFVVTDPAVACNLGVQAVTTGTFQVGTPGQPGSATFSGMVVEGKIYFSATVPTVDVRFVGLSGKRADGTALLPADAGPYTTLGQLTSSPVLDWMAAVVLEGSFWLRLYVGSSPSTVGDLLVAAGFLTEDEEGEFHLALDSLRGKSPTEIAQTLLFSILDALSKLEIPLVSLPGGGIYVVHRGDQSVGDYGLRVTATVPLTSSASTTGNAPPAVSLSLGSWTTGETDASNWLSQVPGLQEGVSIFFLHRDALQKLTFRPSFTLASVGLDIRGGGDAPLVNVRGYTLRGAQLRGYLDSEGWPFGFAVQLQGVGFPVGPQFAAGQQGGGNPVAGNLLAGGGSGSGDASTVNPTFSATAAYIKGKDPVLEIFDARGQRTDLIWFPLQRRFGPISLQKIGVRVDVTGDHRDDPLLGVVLDGGVTLAGLDVYLDQLELDVRLKKATDVSGYSLDLQGMDVTFAGGGVEISGGLIKTPTTDGTVTYDGEALIKLEQLTIAAIGSYSSLPGGGTSLFIFAILNAPIGGPAFCFITGISAGFGYNRSLRIPGQSEVQQFPLVAGLTSPAQIGGASPTPAQALQALDKWVPVTRGEYWLAAGVQFTTFRVINTNALLIVEFGKELVIALLGISTLRQPQVGETYVYAELDIEVVFLPAQGEIRASAVLAPSSFVLTQAAHLTGGFAFYAWFSPNEHAGDFVFTIGGYHPAFKVPAHYPTEPRVGINWPVTAKLSIVGGAYFAITPTAMMAGAGLAVTYDDGPLKAWLKAQADMILFWKPFYLIATASISVGVSYRLRKLGIDVTLSAEIGAEFGLWGPPIGGTAHVEWYVISFTISFGAKEKIPTEIGWTDFKGLLPSKAPEKSSPKPMLAALKAAAAEVLGEAPPAVPAYLHINAVRGLSRSHDVGGMTLWLVRAGGFRFTVGSAIPATTVTVESEIPADDVVLTGQPVGLRRVFGGIGPADYRSEQTVTVLRLTGDSLSYLQGCRAVVDPKTGRATTRPAGCTDKPIDLREWKAEALAQNLPQAMWGDLVPAGGAPDVNPDGGPTTTGTTGVTLYPSAPLPTDCTPQMDIARVFAELDVNPTDERRLPLSQTAVPTGQPPRAASTFRDIARVNTPEVAGRRAAVFVALQEMGVNGWSNGPLDLMAGAPGKDFADEPLEGAPATLTAL